MHGRMDGELSDGIENFQIFGLMSLKFKPNAFISIIRDKSRTTVGYGNYPIALITIVGLKEDQSSDNSRPHQVN